MRAQQTAEVLSGFWKKERETCEELSIYSPIQNFYEHLSKPLFEGKTVLGVGHEPHLSQFYFICPLRVEGIFFILQERGRSLA